MREINTYKYLIAHPEGKRVVGRHRRVWEDNIRMDLSEIRREVMVLWAASTWLNIGASGGFLGIR
jgi:hypothetical protein